MKCALTARYALKDVEIPGGNQIRKQRKNLHQKKVVMLLKIELCIFHGRKKNKVQYFSIFGTLFSPGCCSRIWTWLRHAVVNESTSRFSLEQLVI